MTLTIIIFLIVYIAMGFGTIPGFKVDRTGAAVIGAMAMIAAGSLSGQAAWNAIDYKTMGLLFGLMVISGAFSVSGFYAWTAHQVATLKISPKALLAVFLAVSGLLSSVLTKDVVVVAMTPLLVSTTLARGLNPIPFLLGFCFAANTGSVSTLIGSPQSMIAAQALDVSFMELLRLAGPPALLSLPIVWCILVWFYNGKWDLASVASKSVVPQKSGPAPALNLFETYKASIVMLITVVLFVLELVPQEMVALAAAGILLLNRTISSKDVLKEVDGNLLLLIMGLFIVNAAMATTGLPQALLHDLNHIGVDLNSPVALYFTGAALSNLIGNSPTIMLLVPYLQVGDLSGALCAALILGTGFSSNMIIFGSLAGIVVVEQSKACGVTISFSEFTKSGLPVALITLALGALWVYWI